jgi:hypothetical protein
MAAGEAVFALMFAMVVTTMMVTACGLLRTMFVGQIQWGRDLLRAKIVVAHSRKSVSKAPSLAVNTSLTPMALALGSTELFATQNQEKAVS